MKIEFSRNINAQTALLEYTSDRNYFSSPLSYSVASDKADEFVGKYNKQTSVLSKFCTFCMYQYHYTSRWVKILKKFSENSPFFESR